MAVAATFDCSSYTALQRKHCSCEVSSAAPRSSRAIAGFDSEGGDRIPGYGTTSAERLAGLGYYTPSTLAQLEHAMRVFICAAGRRRHLSQIRQPSLPSLSYRLKRLPSPTRHNLLPSLFLQTASAPLRRLVMRASRLAKWTVSSAPKA